MKLDFNKKYTTISVYVLLCIFFLLILLGIFLNLGDVFGFIGFAVGVLKPIIYGFIISLVVMPLVRFYESKAFKFIFPKNPRSKTRGGISIFLAYLTVVAVIATVILAVAPKLVESYNYLQWRMSYYLTSALNWLEENLPYSDVFAEQYHHLTVYIQDSALASFTNIQKQLPAIFSVFNRVLSETWSIVIGIIVSVYFITTRQQLLGIIRKVMTALFNKPRRDWIYSITHRIYKNFVDYTTGRLLYTLINAVIFYFLMWILNFPYYPLVACIIGIGGIIPVAGTLLGGIIAIFIIFITSPSMAVWFVLLLITVNTLSYIYIQPKIVKARVRRPVGITLIAVIVMGAIFGIVGTLVAVPVYVTAEEIIKSKVDLRLYRKSTEQGTEKL